MLFLIEILIVCEMSGYELINDSPIRDPSDVTIIYEYISFNFSGEISDTLMGTCILIYICIGRVEPYSAFFAPLNCVLQ